NSTTSFLSELESRLISRVVTEHIKDKTLLDGLLHRVHVERLWQPIRTRAAKHLQRLALRRSSKRIERYVLSCRPRCHLSGKHVLDAYLATVLEGLDLCL